MNADFFVGAGISMPQGGREILAHATNNAGFLILKVLSYPKPFGK
jgi:hypothetical protein